MGRVVIVDFGTYPFHSLTQDANFTLVSESRILFFPKSLLHRLLLGAHLYNAMAGDSYLDKSAVVVSSPPTCSN